MYRTILSLALVAMLSLTGCGGSGKESKNNSNSAGASGPSTLPEAQQAEVGMEVDLAKVMEDEAVASALEANPDVPPFVKSLTNLSLYVALPADLQMAADPSNYDFYAKLSFADADSCKAAYDEFFKRAPTQDVEKKGKTFKKISEPGSPTVYILMDGGSIEAYSENYVNSDATSFATEGLRAALGTAPSSEPFKMAVDIAGAKDMLAALGMLAPQAEAFVNSKSLVMAGGGTGDLLFMMAVEANDEETAKKVKNTIQAGMSVIALGAASQMPDEKVAPATVEFMNYMLNNIKPKVEGNTTKVVINKPDNYDELRKKMPAEAKKLQEQMMGKGVPGGGAKKSAGK